MRNDLAAAFRRVLSLLFFFSSGFLQVRKHMGSSSPIKWTKHISPSQVQQLIRAERDTSKALLVFDSATGEYPNGFRHDHHTFALMISRLASANQFAPAEELLARMKDESCSPSEDVFLSICRAYGRAHKPLEALRLFRSMANSFQCESTQKSYVTVFAILVEENQLKLAHQFYNRMKDVGVHQCTASYNVLIKAFCKNTRTIDVAFKVFGKMPGLGCPPDSYTYGTLINGLCKLGRTDEAVEMFKEMGEKGFSPSVVTYSSLIHGLCARGKLEEAVNMFAEMGLKGVEPNVITYSSLMDGLCKGGHSLQAVELLERMIRKRLTPNMITYSTLVNGLCKEGRLPEALEILDRMRLQGRKPDAGLYNKLIQGLFDSGKFQEAANFLDEMVLSGIVPNRVTWSLHVKMHNMVVQGLCSGSDANRAFHVYLSMRTRSITTEPETYHFLVDSYCKKGDLHQAARIVNEMLLDGCVPEQITWSTILGGFWGRRKVREATESLWIRLMNECLGSLETM